MRTRNGNQERREKTVREKTMGIDSLFRPRPIGRGIFLTGSWCVEGGKLVLRYTPTRRRNPWFSRRGNIFQFSTRHGAKGENRTNNCSSKTRTGSAAEQRFLKSIATPDLYYLHYFCREKSDDGGGSNVRLHGAFFQGCAVSCIFHLNVELRHRGFFIKNPTYNPNHRRYNGFIS
ncbi:hypothetical protein JXM67_10500 [candidate division WOR-3 bacterium]|nr:hypothetical protein [candidate division WOR-3 bacterium]